ncbi:MAG: type II toxin-antitoxin system RelE/ParE family toxin [Nitrospinae bacterium]|nr:type II toxin-antitoxin system RelE/ParE family toxin [Nitrospinota bacterium]MBF0634776.1 type II toxin-antitoxin system RelE/ParE family toxin [Nitrospinota bacterium]
MEFVETSLFTRIAGQYLSDEELARLQAYITKRPDAGAVIKGSGGLRKLRWNAGGKGKRGGARIIYYWLVRDDQIFLLTIYGKNEMSDLTRAEVEALSRIVMRWKDA